MKWLGIPLIRGVLAACLVAIVVTSFYYAGAQYLAPPIRHLRQTVSVGLRAHRADKSQGSEGPVKYLLPQDWQADWRSGELWVTHYNPNGTVADSLLFDSVGSFYDWADAHPDFCDLDVDKVAFSTLRAAPKTGDSDKYSWSAMAIRWIRHRETQPSIFSTPGPGWGKCCRRYRSRARSMVRPSVKFFQEEL